jgi:hypothetical protein
LSTPTTLSASVSLPAAALRLGLTYQETWNAVLRGTLPGEKRGTRWYVDGDAVERLAQERRTEET